VSGFRMTKKDREEFFDRINGVDRIIPNELNSRKHSPSEKAGGLQATVATAELSGCYAKAA